MKNKSIIIISVFFFLLFNTSSLWERLPGLWDMAIMTFLILGLFVLALVFLFQLIILTKAKFKDRDRVLSTSILGFVLLFTIFFPFGIERSLIPEEPNLVYAQYEGVANCTETLKLKAESRFNHTSICFGVEHYKGKYRISGDTIHLIYEGHSPLESKNAYGVIHLDSGGSEFKKGNLMYFRNLTDEMPLPMMITQYEL
jgi:hypothetical protein